MWTLWGAGQVWPAVPGGGPLGQLPPHDFKLYFKEGGIGTFYPLYYTLTVRAKQAIEQAAAQRRRGHGAEGRSQVFTTCGACLGAMPRLSMW